MIKEAIAIIIVASAVGLIYNALQPKPLPLLPKDKSEQVVTDSLLGVDSGNAKENLEKTLTLEQVRKLVINPDFIFVDAREPRDYEMGNIGDAVNIYPYMNEEEKFEKIYSLPFEKKIVVYCDGGTCDLSHMIAEDLINNGFEHVFLFTGGWEEWSKKEL